jgi:hypothetical protein
VNIIRVRKRRRRSTKKPSNSDSIRRRKSGEEWLTWARKTGFLLTSTRIPKAGQIKKFKKKLRQQGINIKPNYLKQDDSRIFPNKHGMKK